MRGTAFGLGGLLVFGLAGGCVASGSSGTGVDDGHLTGGACDGVNVQPYQSVVSSNPAARPELVDCSVPELGRTWVDSVKLTDVNVRRVQTNGECEHNFDGTLADTNAMRVDYRIYWEGAAPVYDGEEQLYYVLPGSAGEPEAFIPIDQVARRYLGPDCLPGDEVLDGCRMDEPTTHGWLEVSICQPCGQHLVGALTLNAGDYFADPLCVDTTEARR